MAGFGAFGGVGKAVLVQANAEEAARRKAGLSGGEETGDRGGTRVELFDELSEPGWKLASFSGKGGEPHLPVESGLKGCDLGWKTIGGTGLVFEHDGLPLESVGTAFEGEFGAASGHDREEAIAGGEMPRGEDSFPVIKNGDGEARDQAGGCPQHGK